MARVILSQYIALMEMYQAQLRVELNLLKDISEFEDFDEFKYQRGVALRSISRDLQERILDNMLKETANAFGCLAMAIAKTGDVKNED